MTTKKQIMMSIEKHVKLRKEREDEAELLRMEKKGHSAYLLNNGYRIRYLRKMRIATATKWNQASGMAEVYFTYQGKGDSFSRPAARKALVSHIADGTHKVSFTYFRGSPGMSSDDSLNALLKVDCQRADEDAMHLLLTTMLARRILSHPHEFPAQIVKDLRTQLTESYKKFGLGVPDFSLIQSQGHSIPPGVSSVG